MHVDTRRKLIGFGRRYAAGIVLFMLVAGCANIRPYVPPSEGHIAAP